MNIKQGLDSDEDGRAGRGENGSTSSPFRYKNTAREREKTLRRCSDTVC